MPSGLGRWRTLAPRVGAADVGEAPRSARCGLWEMQPHLAVSSRQPTVGFRSARTSAKRASRRYLVWRVAITWARSTGGRVRPFKRPQTPQFSGGGKGLRQFGRVATYLLWANFFSYEHATVNSTLSETLHTHETIVPELPEAGGVSFKVHMVKSYKGAKFLEISVRLCSHCMLARGELAATSALAPRALRATRPRATTRHSDHTRSSHCHASARRARRCEHTCLCCGQPVGNRLGAAAH